MNKIKVHELMQVGNGQLGTSWMARVDHPVEESFSEGFFSPAASNLMGGDSIRVARLDKGRLLEFVDVVVIERKFGPDHIEVKPVGPVMNFEQAEIEVETVDESMVLHVPEDCTAQWKGPVLRWQVIGESGKVYATGIEDKDVAHSMARGDVPLEAAA